ncbi:MAG TPA: SMP-30/gluconolactonase/LRE family protein [Bryobacteraceae bacterium]|nr:SMP-30/gluconolactonase/LRE family protein [Bryobacteraceae bacterium]
MRGTSVLERLGGLATRRRFATCIALVLTAVSGQNLSDVKMEKIVSGFTFTEGPVWSHDGSLYFSDIPTNRIMMLTPGHPLSVFREASNGGNGNTFDEQGRFYSCESHARRVTRTDKKGKIEVLAERYEGKRLNSPNDIVVRKDGQVYFTDPAFGAANDSRELDFYGVFHISSRGVIEVVAKPKGRPNGIALSPNGRTLYVSNSDERNIRAYDLERNGSASNERVLVSGIEGVPDGLRTDEKGNLYLAAKHLFVYSPDGKTIGKIETSETPSNCAFGDADFQSLYITARGSLYRVRLDVKGSVQY